MIGYLRSPASGMAAQQLAIDVVANNLANVSTVGFKRGHVDFQDLIYRRLSLTGEFGAQPGTGSVSVWLGAGVQPLGITRVQQQGNLVGSDQPLHLAINGEGYFVVRQPDGTAAYTRDGSFRVDGPGRLVTADGGIVQPPLQVPVGAVDVWVSTEGLVYADLGEAGGILQVGEVQLAQFASPAGLLAVGNNLMLATEASGPAQIGFPGAPGFGEVIGSALEMANVEPAVEMSNLILAQRAYQLNARALQTIDEMIGMANNLRG